MSDRQQTGESLYQGRDDAVMDIDRMVNEGLGGGLMTDQNGLIEDTATGTMDFPNAAADSFSTFRQAKHSIKGGSRYAGQPSE